MPVNSRQDELVRYLEDHPSAVPVSDIASHLGVTVRTVLRDVTELRKRGYEIDSARGRGGGLRLADSNASEATISSPDTDRDTGVAQAGQPRRTVFVGREKELQALYDAFGEVRSGVGRVVMLAGEPGIGKTGVVQRLSDRLTADFGDVRVYWGRCYESEGALPYWPWVQVIRAYASASTPDRLREEMGEGASDIAEMVPELHDLLPGLERPSTSHTPEAARFRLFRSVAQFLSRASEAAPMILILEDLHWADRPSLLLLEFIVQELAESPVLLIGTYRDVELNRRHPLGRTLAELNRQQHFFRMTLRGLEPAEVGQIIALASGREPSSGLVDSLYMQTEGNPLFVTEMVNLLLDEGALSEGAADADSILRGRIPEGVREAIGRRLDRLSVVANTVLRVASVMGREFTIQEARRLYSGLSGTISQSGGGRAGDEQAEILPELEEALRARIIERNAGAFASYQFTHSLIRDTLYDELTTPERVRLHRLAGETIESLQAANLDPHLSQLAHHFLEAAKGGNPEKAVHYAERAGDRAVEMVASEEAIRLYGMALQALQLSEGTDDRRRCELMESLGRAQMLAGEITEARETHAAVVGIAKLIGAVDLQAEAAIEFETAGWYPGYDGSPAVELLRDALIQLNIGDSELKARLLGSLGRAYNYAGDFEQALKTGRRAISMARRIGDARTLAITLWSRLPTRHDPSDIHERVAIAKEAIGICENLGRLDMVEEAEAWLINDALELGDIDLLNAVMESWRAKVKKSRVAIWQFNLKSVDFGTSFRLGHFDEAERLSDSLLESGRGMSGMDFAGAHGGMMFALRREQGRLDEVRPALELFLKLNPSGVWRPGLALLYAELDMRDEARQEFERLAEDDFSSIKRDGLFTTTIVNMADVCAYLGDRERAAVLYGLLRPYEGRNIALGIGHVYLGPVSRYMGSLAATMERWGDAERHFKDALDMARKMSSRPQVAHAELAYAQMLSARAEQGDRDQARHLLEDAGATATGLGMRSVVHRIDEALKEIGPEPSIRASYPAGLSEREVDVLRLLSKGRSNLEIGEELYITANTVANHVKNILGKTGASNRTEAAAYAVRNDLVR